MKTNMNRQRISLLAVAASLIILPFLFSGCDKPEENPDLVNPPFVYPTLGIRYLNLSGDDVARTLRLNGEDLIKEIPFGQVSEQINPPADSTYLEIIKDGEVDFRQTKPVKYLVRNLNYTFMSVESKKGTADSLYNVTDSIVYFQTTMVPPDDNEAYLRIFSGMNDSAKYSVRYGCPNGASLLSPVGYGDIQIQAKTVIAGLIPVSVIRTVGSDNEVVGVYELNLEALGQYCLLVLPDYDKSGPVVYLYDEQTAEIESVIPANFITEQTSSIRVINMSSEPVSVQTDFAETIASGLQANSISDFANVTACASQTKDVLYFDTAGEIDTNETSLEVLERYTFVNLDSADVTAYKQLQIPPSLDRTKLLGDSVRIRVINGISEYGSLTLSMGTRNGGDIITTGDYLCNTLPYGEYTQENIFAPGRAPLTLFTSTQPAKLIYAANTEFKPDKDYIIIITKDSEGEPALTIIESEDTSQDVTFMQEGVFAQFVSTASGIGNINLDLTSGGKTLLAGGTISPGSIVATIVPEGELNVDASGTTYSVTADKEKRLLVVIAGDEDGLDIFDINTAPLQTGDQFYTRRFVNATNDIENMVVRELAWTDPEEVNGPSIYGTALKYEVSNISEVTLENKKTFFFFDGLTDMDHKSKISDLIFSFNKAYTIILGGEYDSKSELDSKGYFLTIVQEY
jgi:hypothetical protein